MSDLRKALEGLVMLWPLEGESSTETFERIALAFYKETGYMRPGKDCRNFSPEKREKEYTKWLDAKLENARAALAESTK